MAALGGFVADGQPTAQRGFWGRLRRGFDYVVSGRMFSDLGRALTPSPYDGGRYSTNYSVIGTTDGATWVEDVIVTGQRRIETVTAYIVDAVMRAPEGPRTASLPNSPFYGVEVASSPQRSFDFERSLTATGPSGPDAFAERFASGRNVWTGGEGVPAPSYAFRSFGTLTAGDTGVFGTWGVFGNYAQRAEMAGAHVNSAFSGPQSRKTMLHSPLENLGLDALSFGGAALAWATESLSLPVTGTLDTLYGWSRGRIGVEPPSTRERSNQVESVLALGSLAVSPMGGLRLAKAGALSPAGVTFEGTLYRTVGVGHDPLLIHPRNILNSHRYTEPGQGGLYFGSGSRIVEAEIVQNGGVLAGKQLHVFDTSVDDLLDLTSPTVRQQLGISLDDLTRTGGTQAWRYEVTQPLGSWAQQTGYRGIIAPSAQADGGVNVIVFNGKALK